MKKKKVIVALLASLCVSAGAAGLAACTPKDADGHDSAIYGIYMQYCEAAESNGETPKSYEEWIKSILGSSGGIDGQQGPKGDKGDQGDPGERGDDGVDGVDGIDGDGIDDIQKVNINGKEYFEFTFTSGKIIRIAVDGSEKVVSPSFTITAIDQNGDPVRDAYFNVGYANGDFTNSFLTKNGKAVTTDEARQAYAFKTNNRGIATFYTFPEDTTKNYSVYLAIPISITSKEDIPSIPNGYSVNFGTSDDGFPNTSASLKKDENGNYTATVNFILSNSWDSLYDSRDDLVYKRYVADPDKLEDISVEYTPYEKRVTKNRFNYFTFGPYSVPQYSEEDADKYTNDKYIESARRAASGIYRISWKANSSKANVTLNLYNNYLGNFYSLKNEDGSPSDILVKTHSGNVPSDEKVLKTLYNEYKKTEGARALDYDSWVESYSKTFTGGNYVDVEIPFDQAEAPLSLSYIAEINCDVTIYVERIRDVASWTNQYEEIEMPQNESKAQNLTGSIKDIPFDSTIVKGSDGYYHIGSEQGKTVYVQLTKGTRVNTNSMEYLAHYDIPNESEKGSVFNYSKDEFDEANNSGVHIHTDYTKVVEGYAKLVNSDGLYPVNDLLKTILQNFCIGFSGWQNYPETYWLAACYYYGPVPDGTQDAPYELNGTETDVSLKAEGSTYVSYRAENAGYYGFASKTSGITLNVPGATEVQVQENSSIFTYYYVSLGTQEEVVFSVNGTGTAKISAVTFTENRTIAYRYTESGIEQGTENNPIACQGFGAYLVNIDHIANDAPLVINLKAAPGGAGNYVIRIYGSTTATVLNADKQDIAEKAFKLESSSATKIYIDDVNDGTFFISVTKESATAASIDADYTTYALEAKYRKY